MSPDWFLGFINWRNQRVPLVSYEAIVGGSRPTMSNMNRIAVMNHTGADTVGMDFFALLLQGTPRLLRLTPEDIILNSD